MEILDSIQIRLLLAHLTIFVAAFGFYLHYIRPQDIRTASESTREINDFLRRNIAVKLAEQLIPVFGSKDSFVRVDIRQRVDGTTYREEHISPVGSERYREAIFVFLSGSSRHLLDWVKLDRCKCRWSMWLVFVKLTFLLFVIVQALICAAWTVLLIFGTALGNALMAYSFLLPCGLALLGILGFIPVHYYQGRITGIKATYDTD